MKNQSSNEKQMKTRWFQQIGLTLISGLLATACSSDTRQSATGQPLLLNNFPTQQQTTDYTCGCVAALMVMHYYQVDDATEEELAIQMHTHVDGETPGAQPGSAVRLTDYGTNPQELWQYFHNRKDFQIVASSYRPDSSLPRLTDEARVGIQAVDNVDRTFADYEQAARFFQQQLEAGRPILVCWNQWGGHWTVCIGYNDRGTPDNFDDDLLTMADSYDTTDEAVDGFTQVSLVTFFYDWFCVMSPKPWQLQPYLVVAKK